MKPVFFAGNTQDVLRAFPQAARHKLGAQIGRLQFGLDPDDWKPMASIGSGVREIRVRDRTGAYRAIYVANIGNRVVVLNVFLKKTQATPLHELNLAKKRLRELER